MTEIGVEGGCCPKGCHVIEVKGVHGGQELSLRSRFATCGSAIPVFHNKIEIATNDDVVN